jgi:cytochrome c
MTAAVSRSAVAALVLLGLAACGRKEEPVMPQTDAPSADVAPAAGPAPEQLKALLASLPAPYSSGNPENGKRVAGLCRSCHSFEKGGPNMTGPNLYGVYGKAAGVHPDYSHSQALKSAGITWDAQTLDKWVENPRQLVPGNKMTFAGIKKPQDRVDLVAYLRTQADE